jgi:hypothetical protein
MVGSGLGSGSELAKKFRIRPDPGLDLQHCLLAQAAVLTKCILYVYCRLLNTVWLPNKQLSLIMILCIFCTWLPNSGQPCTPPTGNR